MSAQRFLRVVRLDDSDSRVYDPAAAAGEWAVPGSFAFSEANIEALPGKDREAFARGFLGTASFGRATLVQVAVIEPGELEAVTLSLARHFVARYGAPSLESALPAAREEVRFAQSLCEHEPGTLLAVERGFDSEEITEAFKVFRPQQEARHQHIPLWQLIEDATLK